MDTRFGETGASLEHLSQVPRDGIRSCPGSQGLVASYLHNFAHLRWQMSTVPTSQT